MHPVQIVFILICLVLLAFGVLWSAEQIGTRVHRRVKRLQAGVPADYVTNATGAPPSGLSSPQTDQTADQTDSAPVKHGREQLLTVYRLLRAYGVPREAARQALRGVTVPVDNNLWAEAAPPEKQAAPVEDEIVTPYAGRRTRREFYPDDPDLAYKAPPA